MIESTFVYFISVSILEGHLCDNQSCLVYAIVPYHIFYLIKNKSHPGWQLPLAALSFIRSFIKILYHVVQVRRNY